MEEIENVHGPILVSRTLYCTAVVFHVALIIYKQESGVS